MCTVYLFSSFEKPKIREFKNKKINQLFQGPNNTYVGDSKIRADRGITFHIHIVTLYEGEKDNIIAEQLPTIAAYLPANLSQDVIRQTYQDL